MNRIKLLYVDDEDLNIQLFLMLFSKKFNVITSNSGKEALNILDEHKDIFVVISDMKMPEMNGLEFISKAREKYDNIKYFILTGFEITNEISEALKNNIICSYFKKPFTPIELEQKINDFLNY